MLGTLFDAIDKLEFDEWGKIVLESAEWQDLSVAVLVSVLFGGESLGRWRVSCSNVRNMNLSYERQRTTIRLLSDHVLLWPHTLPHAELYYSGHIANPAAAMGAIWEAHRELVGPWFALDHFLNRLPSHLKYLDGGSGLFATGSIRLIEEYARILRLHGFGVSLLPSNPPVWWDGTVWVPETEPMYVLLLGQSFIIAPRFDEWKLDEDLKTA